MSFDVPPFVEPILRDVASAEITLVFDKGLVDEDGRWTTMVWGLSGGGSGLGVAIDSPYEEQVADVADQIQEIIIEELWAAGRSTAWPECPLHVTHPLKAGVAEARAFWLCPSDGSVIAGIGELALR